MNKDIEDMLDSFLNQAQVKATEIGWESIDEAKQAAAKAINRIVLEARVDEARGIAREYFDGEEFHPELLQEHIAELNKQIEETTNDSE